VRPGTFAQAFSERYLSFDGRSLALCRVGLAGVLIVDVLRRIPWLRDLYSNAGLLPNHTELWRPWQPHLFSFYFMTSLPGESAVLFAVSLFCFVCLAIGWRTRLFHLLSFAMTTSLHERNLIAENGGTVALATLMVWTAFLPLGRRFSVDALLASLRGRPEEQPDDLAHDRLPSPDTRPVRSLAVLAVLLQLAVVYWFNFVHKSGATWRTGTAIHYVLHQERIVTVLGLWARNHLPFSATKALTYGTLGIEAAAPFLILSPVFWKQARGLAIFLLSGLHIGIALLVNVGIFSPAMMAYYPLLIDGAFWDWAGTHDGTSPAMPGRGRNLVAMRGRRRDVIYDAGCGVCFQIVRILARLDVFRRLTWVRSDDLGALPAGIERETFERTVVVADRETGRTWTRADAFAELFSALPLGRTWAWVFRVPGLSAISAMAYDAFSRNRMTISVWLGFAACSTGPRVAPAPPPPATTAGPSLLRGWIEERLPALREVAVAVALVVFAADMSVSNTAIPEKLRWTGRPEWMTTIVQYTHASEGWSMFSPDAPIYDMMVVVDAITKSGRHVDPYNEVGSRVHDLPVDDIPPRLGHDSMFCDYTLRIPGTGAYHQALIEWIQRYPERTGSPDDAITSFTVTKLEHTPPPPGETRATDVRRNVFLKWP
jgi:predicted DCC family thiol-disulfide oxidoreductase YuxK